MLNSALTIA